MADNNQITSGMQFRRALLQISKQLSESEVEEMKFLIAGLPDKPGFAELEEKKAGRDVFMLLMKRGDISEENYYLLGFLLNEIGQKALVKRFKQLLSTDSSSVDTSESTPGGGSTSRNSSLSSPDNASFGASPKSSDQGYASQSHVQTPNVSANSPQPQATSTLSSTPPVPKYDPTSTPPTTNYKETDARLKFHQMPSPTNAQAVTGSSNQRSVSSESKSTHSQGQNSGQPTSHHHSLDPSPGSSASPSADGSGASNQGTTHLSHGFRNSGQRSSQSNKSQNRQLQKQDVKASSQCQKISASQQLHNYKQTFAEDPLNAKPPSPQAQLSPPRKSSNSLPGNAQSASSKGTVESANLVQKQTEQIPSNDNPSISSNPVGKHSTQTFPSNKVTGQSANPVGKQTTQTSPDVQHHGSSPSVSNTKMHQVPLIAKLQQEGSASGSYGYHTLKSVEVPLTGSPSRSADVLDGIPRPDSSNFGPPIEPPSDSLSEPSKTPAAAQEPNKDVVKGNAPRDHTTGGHHPDKVDLARNQPSAFPEQKSSTENTTSTNAGSAGHKTPKQQISPGQSSRNTNVGKVKNIEKQMSKLSLENQGGQCVTQQDLPKSNQTTLTLDDIETDAPGDDDMDSTSMKSSNEDYEAPSLSLSGVQKLWSSPDQKQVGIERSNPVVPPGFSGANITPMKDGDHGSSDDLWSGEFQHSSLSSTSLFPVNPSAGDKDVFDVFPPNGSPANLSPVGNPGQGAVPRQYPHSNKPIGALPPQMVQQEPMMPLFNQAMNPTSLLGHVTEAGQDIHINKQIGVLPPQVILKEPMVPSSNQAMNQSSCVGHGTGAGTDILVNKPAGVLPLQMVQKDPMVLSSNQAMNPPGHRGDAVSQQMVRQEYQTISQNPSRAAYDSNPPYHTSQTISNDGGGIQHHRSVPTSSWSNASHRSHNMPPSRSQQSGRSQQIQRTSSDYSSSQTQYSPLPKPSVTSYHGSASDTKRVYSQERPSDPSFQVPEQSFPYYSAANPIGPNYESSIGGTPLDGKGLSSAYGTSGVGGFQQTHGRKGVTTTPHGRSSYESDVRKKNVPAFSAGHSGVTRQEEDRRMRGTNIGDSAHVMPVPSHGPQTSYASSHDQLRTDNSPGRNLSLEDIKRKAANSIAKHDSQSRNRKSPPKGYQEEGEDLLQFEKKTLRKYQDELSGPAKTGDNYIICAPTGSGKTLTAASICLHLYEQARARGHMFKALFIVNIRHLTQQQTTAFNETFPVGRVGTIGETEQLRAVFFEPDYAVVMVTAQILLNALKKSPTPDLNLQDISLIVFDECHHTTQDHPYNEIMKRYLKEKKMKLDARREVGKSGPYLPQILGLSASLGVGHGKNAFRHVLTLCSNMDAKNVVQVHKHKDELDRHVNSPEQDVILYCLSRHVAMRDLGDVIGNIMTTIESQLWTETPSHATQVYEQWVVNTRKTAEENSDQNRILACLYLFEYNRALLLYEDLRAVDAFVHLENFMKNRYVGHNLEPIEELCRELFQAEREEMKRISMEESDSHNPKLLKLAKLLKQKFTEKPHSKGIVLTRMRLGTMALENFIKETKILRGLACRVRPVRLVGQGEVENFFMTESQQKQALELFRKDDSCNLLVATDIAQEGLDMPACNFVIRYNFVSNEIGTVQSKGRARAEQSECFLIVEQGSQNASRELDNRQKVVNMQEAMQKLNDLPEIQRLQEITKRQDEIYEEMEAKDTMTKLVRGIHKADAVEILCKECNMHITYGCHIRKKGCHFTCVDPDIKKKVHIVKFRRPQVYRDTHNIGNFKCGNTSCGQQLGVAILFLESEQIIHRGYGFKVQSFLFKLPDGSKKTFKQWKKVTFDIPEM